jgi:hypothetical protein
MFSLNVATALQYVRRALDELTSVEEIGMIASPDSLDLETMVEGAMVEAAVRVHENANVLYLDGQMGWEGDQFTAEGDDEGVGVKLKATVPMVRVVSIKASDSDYTITEFLPEDSAEARKQKNKYTRGTYDDPRAVLNKVNNQEESGSDHTPCITYYSMREEGELPEFTYEYVPYPEINETEMEICPRLEYAVLNEITAMVLESLGEMEKAKMHRERYAHYMQKR